MSLFPPPQEIETTVAFELPETLRRPNTYSDWGQNNQFGHMPDSFLEGPSFDKDGNLWMVNIPFGQILRVTPAGEWSVATEYDGNPNGLKIRNDGQIFIADYKNGVMHLDPSSGNVTGHRTRIRTEPFRGCNDLHFASNGDLYFTDQGQSDMQRSDGRVFRLTPDDHLECLIDCGVSPNGLVLSHNEKMLFVGMTRACQVWHIPLPPDGGPYYKIGVFQNLSGGPGGPDGMCLDDEGNLYVTHVGLGIIWVFGPTGIPLYRINSCRGAKMTNMAFGGPENKTLFITESDTGTILRAEMPHAGKVMYSHM